MEEKRRTLGYICPQCRQSVAASRSLFSLSVGKMKLPCPCGKSELTVDYLGSGHQITVPCAACGGEHRASLTTSQMMGHRILGFACPERSVDCCYIGEEGAVFAAMKRLEETVDKLEARKEEESPFLDEMIMSEMLGEIRDIAQRGDISCSCGSKRWGLEVHYSSIELRCADCAGKLRLPAATMEDLADLCAKPRLVIRGGKS